MSRKTVAQTRDSIRGLLSGLALGNVVNLDTAMERTARELTQLLAIPEAVIKTPLTLYNGVTDYVGPTDGFSSFVDIRPQGNSRIDVDYPYHNTPVDFDRNKNIYGNGYNVVHEYVNGIGRLRITSRRPLPKIELDAMTEDTGWTAAGSAGSLAEDSTVFWNDPSSLRLTLTGASVGTLTKTISAQDLTDYVGRGVVFLAMRTPDITNLTSIAVRIGSDSSNYYEVSNTTGFLGAWTINEWLLTALDLSGATTTGTPTVTAIDYAQIRITHGATITNFYVGDLWISLPSPHDLFYASDAIFQPAAAGTVPLQTITLPSDTILLNDDALLIYELLSAANIAQQQGGEDGQGIISTLNKKLYGSREGRTGRERPGLIDLYRARNLNQDVPMVDSYY